MSRREEVLTEIGIDRWRLRGADTSAGVEFETDPAHPANPQPTVDAPVAAMDLAESRIDWQVLVRNYRTVATLQLSKQGQAADAASQVNQLSDDIGLAVNGLATKPLLQSQLFSTSGEQVLDATKAATWIADLPTTVLALTGQCPELIALIEREREVHNKTRSRRPGRGRPGLPCQTDRVALIRDVRRVLRLPPVEVDVDVVADDEATTPPDRWMPRLLEGVPTDPRALASMVLTTLYLGQEGSSSEETRDRATRLSHEIGAQFLTIPIHTVTSALLSLFRTVFGVTPTFKSQGGSVTENLALQNIQARVRMVVTFLCAQLLPWVRGQTDGSFLLVLGSANVDECLRGYMTKYDCSSADINPIGGISKRDIRRFLRYRGYGGGGYAYPTLLDIETAPPTAELEPLSGQRPQTDEEDMGMTYADLTLFGIWRKVHRMGPVSMFRALLARETRRKKKKTPKKEEKETEREEKKEDSPHQRGGRRKDREGKTHVQEDDDDEQGKTMAQQVAERVKHFFQSYAINRHKATTLTPSYHAEGYGYVVG